MAIAGGKHRRLTADEYLNRERAAEFRSEYAHGEFFAMSGGTVRHSLIASNLNRIIGNQFLGRPCLVFTSDMKVWMEAADTFAYPDVSALSGPIDYRDDVEDIITNPSFIAEILSDSTEAYDRGEKFARYRTLSSFREYLLVSQKRMRAERYTRQQDGSWLLHVFEAAEDAVDLDSIGCSMKPGDLYDKVEFAAG